MDEINLKNFPQDIATTSNVTKDTKVLIANGVNTYVTTLSSISKLLGVNSEKVESILPGELPYLDTKNNRYMEVTEEGDYYFEGVLLANNPRGYITIFWWDGDSWEFSSQYRVLGEKGDGVEDATVNEDGDLIITYTDGVIANAGHVKGEKGDRVDPLPYSEWSPEDVDKLIEDVNINAQRIPAITAGELPTPPQPNMYMVVTDVGAYTYGGNTIGTNADGYQTTFWWNGTTWTNNGSVKVKGDTGVNGRTIEDFNIEKAGGYLQGDSIYFTIDNETNIYKVIENASEGESPITHPTKFEIVNIGISFSKKTLSFDIVGKFYNKENGELLESIPYLSTSRYKVISGMNFINPFMGAGIAAQSVYFKEDGTFLSSELNQDIISVPEGAFEIGFSTNTDENSIQVEPIFWAYNETLQDLSIVKQENLDIKIQLDGLTASFNDLEKLLDENTDANYPLFIDQSLIIRNTGVGKEKPNFTIPITSRDTDFQFSVAPINISDFNADEKFFSGVVELSDGTFKFLPLKLNDKATGKIGSFETLPTPIVNFASTQGDSQHLSRFGYKALAEGVGNAIVRTSYRKTPILKAYSQDCVPYEKDWIKSGTTLLSVTRLPNTATGGWIVEGEIANSCEMYGNFSQATGRKFKNSYKISQNGANRGFTTTFNSGVNGFLRIILNADLRYNVGLLNVEVKDQDNTILYNQNATRGSNQEVLVDVTPANKTLTLTFKTVNDDITLYEISSIEIFKTYNDDVSEILQKQGLNVAFLCDSWGEFPLLESGEVGFTRPNGSIAGGLGYLAFHLQDYLQNEKGININVFNTSKGGQTSAWGSYWLKELILDLPTKPDYCVINFAINDANSISYAESNIDSPYDFSPTQPYTNLVMSAGGIKGSVTNSQWLDNMTSICQRLLNAGIKPIVLMNPLLGGVSFGLIDQHLLMLNSIIKK